MRSFKSGIIGLMMLAGTCASALAGQEMLQGGHDGGGGGVQLSSEAEVREAIKWAMEELRKSAMNEKRGLTWLRWAFGGPEVKRNNGKEVAVTICLSSPYLCKDTKEAIEGNTESYINAWDFLKLSPLEIKGTGQGACPAPDKKDAAASVSEYKVGAKLCFSVDVLRKTPSNVIRGQVTSILAHEMSHLLGYGEEIAEGVQNTVYASFSRAAMEEIQRIRNQIMSELLFARVDLDQVARGVLCSNLACDNAGLKVMSLLGNFHGRITMILGLLPIGPTKEPSMAAKQEIGEKAYDALKAPWLRMYNLQMDIIEGKSSVEQQMEQAIIARNELAAAELLVSELLGTAPVSFR